MSLEDKEVPEQPQESAAPKVFTLQLNADEVNGVLGALGELPAKASMGLIMNIQRQCTEQAS